MTALLFLFIAQITITIQGRSWTFDTPDDQANLKNFILWSVETGGQRDLLDGLDCWAWQCRADRLICHKKPANYGIDPAHNCMQLSDALK